MSLLRRRPPRLRPTAVALAAALGLLAVPATAPAATTTKKNPWLDMRVLVQAHQGGEDELPSNTMYAFRTALRRGADMLELDVGATKDGHVVVLHDNTVDRVTNGHGSITDMTLAEIQRLDAAYWFVPGRNAVHGLPASAYPFRGVRTGDRPPPRGFEPDDFRIPTLEQVLRAFPRTPINVEIKGRDGQDQAVFDRTADLLAGVLKRSGRTDIIVTSFNQAAIDRFHAQVPNVPLAPGIAGMASYLLAGASPGEGVVAFQVPITYSLGGTTLTITTPAFVQRAHEDGYAVHVWLSDDTENEATYRSLLDMCVDGIMAAKPSELMRVLATYHGDPCTSRPLRRAAVAGRTATLTLVRHGLSQEARHGTLKLRARRGHGRGHGALLGRATYDLAAGAAATTVDVRLTGAVRRALRRHRKLDAVAITREHGKPVYTQVKLRRSVT